MEECDVFSFAEALRGEFDLDTGSSLMAVTLADVISSARLVSVESARLTRMLSFVGIAEPSRPRSLRAISIETKTSEN